MAARMLVFFVLVALARGQPESEDMSGHCRLDTSDPTLYKLICENMTNEEQLANEFFVNGRPNATWLVIANSHFQFFSHDAFVETNFTEIEIVNCTIRSLTDTDIAFQGLEETLVVLYVTNTMFVDNWDWNHLRNMNALSKISVKTSDVHILTDSIKRIPRRVHALEFDEDGVSWIHPNAFSSMRLLNTIMLPRNEITSIQRSMFPNPATYLVYIQLSGNHLSSLPSDIFTNMPVLWVVDLSHNLFHTIEDRVFGAVVRQLLHLDFQGNDMRCDCRIKWLSKMHLSPQTVMANCTSPSHLIGFPVVGLAGVRLWC